ncbi:GNAT family N-acetyltransferase [Streptomyces violaceusniger]|uniref:N-acetyltransferase domain-containing protein n=1 Tax=Streptomyces violaceusniger TaxID=68280 RepID=A0A4D4KMY4_STRVO|nr:hypothetical protein SVIO_001870 [Streptomyces violaceusniger]
MQVDPDYPELAHEVLDWFDELAAGGPREITLLEAETDLCGLLRRRGYEGQEGASFFAYHSRPLADLPEPELPAGFVARSVRGAEDLERRVAVHQAAWNSVRVTTESYQVVMSSWPYRPELDWVVEDVEGRFAANCLIWYDDRNGVGLIEPVGTDPQFRRRGLSRAVCLAALHALRDVGASTAIVYPRGDAAYPIPQILYQGMGFRPYARTRTYLKEN